MKIKTDVVQQALEKLSTAGAPLPSLDAITQAVREATGVEVSRTSVKDALTELETAGKCQMQKEGKSYQVFFISTLRLAAWNKADALAATLGGTADKRSDETLAGVYLTLEQAEALVSPAPVAAKTKS